MLIGLFTRYCVVVIHVCTCRLNLIVMSSQVSALQEVLEFMDKLETRVCHVETLCQNSLSTVRPDLSINQIPYLHNLCHTLEYQRYLSFFSANNFNCTTPLNGYHIQSEFWILVTKIIV